MNEDDRAPSAAKIAAWQLGVRAEEAVVAQLVASGWTVLDRNWRGGGGELDVVIWRDGQLRFVEVKARVDATIDAEESLMGAKRPRLVSAAQLWLDGSTLDPDGIAFLVVVVDCTVEPWAFTWYDDAFDAG